MPRELKCPKWKGQPFRYAHAKRDGLWITLCTDAEGWASSWTRMPRNVTEKLEWHPRFNAFARLAPALTTVFCEAWVKGGTRADVKGAMRDGDDRLQLECFAVERYGGEWIAPSLGLEDVSDYATDLGLYFAPWVLPQGLHKDGLLASQLIPHTEGWVVKDGNLLNWRKVKPVETYDLVVVGFTRGRGKYHGMIGACVLADGSGTIVGKCSGMDDATRRHMTDYREWWLGQLIEVKAQGRASAGGLDHPRYVRVRDDKTRVDTL